MRLSAYFSKYASCSSALPRPRTPALDSRLRSCTETAFFTASSFTTFLNFLSDIASATFCCADRNISMSFSMPVVLSPRSSARRFFSSSASIFIRISYCSLSSLMYSDFKEFSFSLLPPAEELPPDDFPFPLLPVEEPAGTYVPPA